LSAAQKLARRQDPFQAKQVQYRDASAAAIKSALMNAGIPGSGLSKMFFTRAGATAAPFASPDGPSFSDLLRNFGAPAGTDPEDSIQPAPPPLDDDEEQTNLRALDTRLSSTGNIRDAVALYNARRASRRYGQV
jgi:hypothetical protein